MNRNKSLNAKKGNNRDTRDMRMQQQISRFNDFDKFFNDFDNDNDDFFGGFGMMRRFDDFGSGMRNFMK